MATDSLFRIIKSMTTGEKIHFKRSSNKKTGGEKPSYLILFDIVDASEAYDKSVIEKKLKAKKIKINYSETKNYLYGLLVEFIETYNSECTLNLKATRLLGISKIMFEKGLYEEALEYLKKAKEIAKKYQMYEMMLQIHSHEINLIGDSKEDNRFVAIEKELFEKEETIHRIGIINPYLGITYLMTLLCEKEPSSRDKEIIAQARTLYDKIQHLPETTLFYPNFIKHTSCVLFFKLTQNFVRVKEHCEQIIVLCQQNPAMAKRFSANYYSVLEQYLTALHFYNEYSNYSAILNFHSETSVNLGEHIELAPVLFKEKIGLSVLITKGEIELAGKHLALLHLESFIPNSNLVILTSQYKLILQYACTYFLNKQYKEAQKCVQKILTEFNLASAIAIQIHYTAKMMQLLIAYERKDFVLLNDLIQSTQKYFLRHQKLYELEVILFSMFRELLKNETDALIWEESKNKLTSFDSYFLHEYFGFDIIAWIDSKNQQRLISDVLKEKAIQFYPEIFEVRVVLDEAVKNSKQ